MVSNRYRVASSAVALTLFEEYGRRWLWPVAALLAGGVAAAVFVDWRWALVTVMFLLVALPGILLCLYFFYALRPLTALNATLHCVAFDDDAIRIVIYRRQDPPEDASLSSEDASLSPEIEWERGEADKESEKKGCEEKKDDDTDVNEEERCISFPYAELERLQLTDSGFIIYRRHDWLMVPASAFDEADFQKVVSFIRGVLRVSSDEDRHARAAAGDGKKSNNSVD